MSTLVKEKKTHLTNISNQEISSSPLIDDSAELMLAKEGYALMVSYVDDFERNKLLSASESRKLKAIFSDAMTVRHAEILMQGKLKRTNQNLMTLLKTALNGFKSSGAGVLDNSRTVRRSYSYSVLEEKTFGYGGI